MWRNLSFKSSVTFSLDNPGTNFDSVLYIRQTNCASGVEFCNDDVAFLALTSEVGLINVPAGDYYIFIDGYGGQSGNYELTIDLP